MNLKKALELQKGTGKKAIGEVLVENGFITEEMIARALQTQLGLKVDTADRSDDPQGSPKSGQRRTYSKKYTSAFPLNWIPTTPISFTWQWQTRWIWLPSTTYQS